MTKTKTESLKPCDIIFNHVEKPKNFLMCRGVNVFDDKWRVNIYSKRFVDGIEDKCISASYFVKFDPIDNNLQILG